MSAPVASDTRSPFRGEQGDKRVLGRIAEPGSDQRGADLVPASARAA